MSARKARFNMKDKTNPALRQELPPAAQRALAEAEARRRENNCASPPKEIGGPNGKEPTRYGDWEKGGRTVDF